MSRYVELANRVFKETHAVYLLPAEKIFLQDDITVQIDDIGYSTGSKDMWGGTYELIEDTDTSDLVLSYFNRAPNEYNEDVLSDMTQKTVSEYNLTTNDFVELICNDMQVEFVNMKSVVLIHELLTDYLKEIEYSQLYDVNFQGPSKEDIRKMVMSRDTIAEWAKRIQDGTISGSQVWKDFAIVGIRAMDRFVDPNQKLIDEYRARRRGEEKEEGLNKKTKADEWNPYAYIG